MGVFMILVSLAVVFLAVFPAWKTLKAGDNLSVMYPNLLLFFPDEDTRELTKKVWKESSNDRVDTSIVYEPTKIPSIDASVYTFDSLRKATDDFHRPAVVKGLFKGSPALEKWGQDGYLARRIGSHLITVIHEAVAGTNQRNRSIAPFDEAVTEVLTNEESMDYLFFPFLSRDVKNDTLNTIREDVDRVVREDLLTDRIFKGFATKSHTQYVGSQMIIGRGKGVDSEETTGTAWHCAIANNYFVQAVGMKRWYFLDPKHSSYLKPLRGGMMHMMVGVENIGKVHDHMPLRYVDLEPGDLLFNPPWQWHTTKNFPGLAIGVPIREQNIPLSFSNNFQYSSIVALNLILKRLGFSIKTF